MRGSPLRQLFLTLAGVLLAGVPLYILTMPATPNQQEWHESAPSLPDIPAYLTVRCAHTPSSIVIRSGDRILLERKSPVQLVSEHDVSLPIPASGTVRLKVEASWPENTPDTPITLILEPERRNSRTETRWSVGQHLNDLYTFSWPSS